MDQSTLLLTGLALLVLLVIAFFAVFRGRGKVNLDTPFGNLKAEGENPPPPTAVPGGVKIKDAGARKNLTALSTGPGGVDLEKVQAGGNLDARHEPGDSPPKS